MVGNVWWLILLAVIAQSSLVADSRFISRNEGFVDSRGLRLQELAHRKTGAKLVVIVPKEKEKEKGFAVSFRTPAVDDTGVTHILEHSVFEGSKKYPVMNSISHFDRSSMATFVNAMTAPETTMYPVATVDSQDLLNLASVYLDGVFDPLILTNRTGFDREGWHYTLIPPDGGTLAYGGVVYNEMKGVYSNPKSLISRTVRRLLYENSTLGLESGGHPEYIPSLSYEDAIKYYKLHYHPANSYFYYYGDLDRFDELMDLIDYYCNMAQLRFQKEFKTLGEWIPSKTVIRLPQLPQLPPQLPPLPGSNAAGISPRPTPVPPYQFGSFVPYTGQVTAPLGNEDNPNVRVVRQRVPSTNNKSSIRVDSVIDFTKNYSACDLQAISVLSSLFAATKESPLWTRLEAEKLGDNVVGSSISTTYPAIQFALQIDGVDPDWVCSDEDNTVARSCQGMGLAEHILHIIDEEVDKAAFDHSRVHSLLKRLEFSLKAQRSTHSTHAIEVFEDIIDPWIYDDDVFKLLDTDAHLACVRARYNNNPNYFRQLLHELHPIRRRKVVVMKSIGNSEVSKERENSERLKLMRMQKTMKPSELKQIALYAQLLQDAVNTGDSDHNLSTLPTLSIDKINPTVEGDSYELHLLQPTGSTAVNSGSTHDAALGPHRSTQRSHSLAMTDNRLYESRYGAESYLSGLRGLATPANEKPTEERDASAKGYDVPTEGYQELPFLSMVARDDDSLMQGSASRAKSHGEADDGVLETLWAIKDDVSSSADVESAVYDINLGGVATRLDALQAESPASGVPLFYYPASTGGLAFVTLHFDLSDLTLEDLSHIGLISYLFNHGYVAGYSPKELRERLDTYTGGLSLDWFVKETKRHPSDKVSSREEGAVTGSLKFRCLVSDLEICVTLIEDILLKPNFEHQGNLQFALNWLRKEKNAREALTLKNPNSVASQKVRGLVNARSRLVELIDGADSVEFFIRPLIEQVGGDGGLQPPSAWSTGLGKRLKRTWSRLLAQQNLAVQLTCDTGFRDVRERLLRLVDKLPTRIGPWSYTLEEGRRDRESVWLNELRAQWQPAADGTKRIITADILVNYNYLLLPLQEPGEDTHMNWSLCAKILTNKFLTPQVRMIGGAYGVWSQYSYHDGYLVFGSYRDPHHNQTFDAYRASPPVLGRVARAELDGYVIRFVADMDKPASAVEKSNRQFNRWAENVTKEQRQAYRDDVLKIDLDQVLEFMKVLNETVSSREGIKVTVGTHSLTPPSG